MEERTLKQRIAIWTYIFDNWNHTPKDEYDKNLIVKPHNIYWEGYNGLCDVFTLVEYKLGYVKDQRCSMDMNKTTIPELHKYKPDIPDRSYWWNFSKESKLIRYNIVKQILIDLNNQLK